MSRLTHLAGFAQLRVAPVKGGKDPATFVYTVRVPEGFTETNYQFVKWAVGDFNRLGKTAGAAA